MLNSNNVSFILKKVILENFSNRDYLFFVELYANYDCEVNEKYTIKNLITAFSSIVQIRYSKKSPKFFKSRV